MNWQRIILGDLVDVGYSIKEYDGDHTVTVKYKDETIGAYPQIVASAEMLREKAQKHFAKIATPAGVTQ
jgi:hypothetical protein